MVRSSLRYMSRTGGQALRCLLHASPLAVFGRGAVLALVATVGCTAWFLWGYQSGGLHLSSLLAAVLSAIFAVGFFVAGLIADGINSNRRLLEEALLRLKALESATVVERVGESPGEGPLVRRATRTA